MRIAFSSLVSVVFLIACSDDDSFPSDASTDSGNDVGVLDASRVDADARDSGLRDVGVRDAALSDARDSATGDAGPVACPSIDAELRDAIYAAYDGSLATLEQWTDADRVRANPNGIYNVQLQTANYLLYAELTGDLEMLRRLVALYTRGFDSLTLREQAHYYYARGTDGVVRREQVLDLDRPTRMWTHAAEAPLEVGPEAVLPASQFLYAVARTLRLIAERPELHEEFAAFAAEATELLVVHHYERWIHRTSEDAPGSFQRHAWGCARGAFDHAEHIANLLDRRYGTAELGQPNEISYCNALTDVALFIGGGLAEVLVANEAAPDLAVIAGPTRTILAEHARSIAELLESRHDVREVNHEGEVISVAVLDPGAFDDHSDHGYAGFEENGPGCETCADACTDVCDIFPGHKSFDPMDTTPRIAPVPATGTGWDLSHARRIPLAFDSLWRHSGTVGNTFPTRADIAAYANQLAYVVWNGSVETPHYTNYFDGSDGWYRVNYSGRVAHGNAPGQRGAYVGNCSFGFWESLSPRLAEGLAAARTVHMEGASDLALGLFLPETAGLSFFSPACR